MNCALYVGVCFQSFRLYSQFNVRFYLNLTFSRFQIKHHYFAHGLFGFLRSLFFFFSCSISILPFKQPSNKNAYLCRPFDSFFPCSISVSLRGSSGKSIDSEKWFEVAVKPKWCHCSLSSRCISLCVNIFELWARFIMSIKSL